VAGFALLLAGLAAGAAMIARGETLIKAGHRQEAYDTAGFLKGFHAVTLHGVLVLPALAWLLTRTRLPEPARTRVVALGIGAYASAAVVVLALNVRGT
jgi:hypothetical protein